MPWASGSTILASGGASLDKASAAIFWRALRGAESAPRASFIARLRDVACMRSDALSGCGFAFESMPASRAALVRQGSRQPA